MKISKRQLKRIIKESMDNIEQSYISKINTLLGSDDYKTHSQGIELIKGLSKTMPGLMNHPDLMIHTAHDDDGEAMHINYRYQLTKAEAESFKEFDGEKVYLKETHAGENGIGTRHEYAYSFPGWNSFLGGRLRRG